MRLLRLRLAVLGFLVLATTLSLDWLSSKEGSGIVCLV